MEQNNNPDLHHLQESMKFAIQIVKVTSCSVSLAIMQSPYTKVHLTQHRKPPRFKGQHIFKTKMISQTVAEISTKKYYV